jgi:hypothetical protein
MEDIAIGKVIKFFSKIGEAAIRIMSGELNIEDTIKPGDILLILIRKWNLCRWATKTLKRLS